MDTSAARQAVLRPDTTLMAYCRQFENLHTLDMHICHQLPHQDWHLLQYMSGYLPDGDPVHALTTPTMPSAYEHCNRSTIAAPLWRALTALI